jgi:hypothetical protein
VLLMEGFFLEYVIEMDLGGMIYLLSFISKG